MNGETEDALLKRAVGEEKAYNWVEAANLYEQIVKSYLDKKLVDKAASTYKKIGYSYAQGAEKTETVGEYKNLKKKAIASYKTAENFFNQINDKREELECKAEALFISGLIAKSIIIAKEKFFHSNKIFKELNELYYKKNEQNDVIRISKCEVLTSFYLMVYSIDQREIEEIFQRDNILFERVSILPKDTQNFKYFAEIYYFVWLILLLRTFVIFEKDERTKDLYDKFISEIENLFKSIKDINDLYISGLVYITYGKSKCVYGFQLIEDERVQSKYINKGIELIEKGLKYIRETNNKYLLIDSIYWLDWWALFGGNYEFVQKRIAEDIKEVTKLGEIYSGLFSFWRFFAYLLPAFYYANISQRGFFTTHQRISFAEKGIENAKECLKIFSYSPFSSWAYQMLTISYSLKTTVSKNKEEQSIYAQKMLKTAEKVKKNTEKYKPGFAAAAGYSSIYRAYKTLSEIAENDLEKNNMLSKAINASEKYLEYSIESRTGIISGKMRLGLLYEEISIKTGEKNPIMKAKEIFLEIIKQSLERGYHSYAAATHEYIAHIEDRLGNHTVSAEHYKKAQKSYTESLKTIEYKPLKDRVKEKINYTRAWNLIEQGKIYHKRENHLHAKENYEKAYEILKELPSYKYEAEYYSAWILLEEAEQLSKQEMHEEAIKRYDLTIESFDNTIKILEKAFKDSKNKMEREKIKKLEKLARVRINHCSARISVEKARILGMQGEHIEAAEEFASAALKFKVVCNQFKIEKERNELEAGYYLCKAWGSMELAENYGDSNRFAEAVELFTKASKLFFSSKMKSLALGNSAFCQALECGCKFDETTEKNIKAELYPKIKMMLRKAADSYRKGGFENGADWALATSTYFDAAWHLIRADEEMRLDKKKKLLEIGAEILKSASEFFSKAGYKDKEREILERLDMVKKEEKILISALNTIKEPTLSRSTAGIVAPACPIETSLSPRLGEIRQFTEESIRVSEERVIKKKYKLIYRNLLEKYTKIQMRECRVGIAQIGLSKSGDILNEFYEEKSSGLLGLQEDKVEFIRSNIKNMIQNAHANEINILLFPEMTIDLNYGELLEDISNLAKTYEMLIIPGSYHDQETKRNLSIVIGPEGILWEQEKHIPAIIHFEGKRFKEGINVGDIPQKTIICNTEFGRIAIVICRDFLDMDLRVELKNFEPPVDIILNPAFTPVTADFRAAHFDARRSIYAYCFFANIAEFGDSLIYAPEKERIERTIQPKEEDLIYKDIDLFKLRSERKKWEIEQKKERQFIQSTR